MDFLLGGLLTALGLTTGGALALLPHRMADAPPSWRRGWATAAVPLLLLAYGLLLWNLRENPDAALAAGIHSWNGGSKVGRIAWLLAPILLLGTTLAALVWERLNALGWRLLALLGLLGWGTIAAVSEGLRIGEGPGGTTAAFVAAVASRCTLGLAAAQAVGPGKGRWQLSVLGPLAAAAIALYLLIGLPEGLRLTLWRQGALATAFAAGALFLLSPFLPPSLRRVAGVAGTFFAGILLHWAATRSADLAGTLPPPTEFQ